MARGVGGVGTHFLFIFPSSAILSLDPKSGIEVKKQFASAKRFFCPLIIKPKSGELESAQRPAKEWKSDDCINSSLFLTFLASLVCAHLEKLLLRSRLSERMKKNDC
jgi:hypothetical protein